MTMKNFAILWCTFLLLGSGTGFSQAKDSLTASAHTGQQQTKTAAAPGTHERDGAQVFAQNCSRCHTAPQGFSSRISGTVVRHMRVRASLSQHDEQELLRFLNP